MLVAIPAPKPHLPGPVLSPLSHMQCARYLKPPAARISFISSSSSLTIHMNNTQFLAAGSLPIASLILSSGIVGVMLVGRAN